jgi:long-chain acyl-CoA synthetase
LDENQYLEQLEKLWREKWPENLPQRPQYPFGEVSLVEYLKKRAELTPEKACIIFYGKELTFRQLDLLSTNLASYLKMIGVKKKDRIAVFLPNCPQFLIAFYGILKAGCVHVPVNPMFKEQELIYELSDTDAEIVITLDHLYASVDSVKEKTVIREIITTNIKDFLPTEPTIPLHESMPTTPIFCPGATSLLTILDKEYSKNLEYDRGLDDLAALNYTGGTTGMPKGCEHTEWNMLYTAACSNTFSYQMTEADVRLTYMPVFWIAGENAGVIAPVFTGATHILLYRWDTTAALEAIHSYKVTVMNGVLDNFVQMMEHRAIEDYDLHSLRTTTVSSFVKKLSIEIRQQWQKLTGTVIREASFGMTETHTMDTFTTGFQFNDMDLKVQPVFCGLPMPGTKIKIVDFDSGELLPLGQEGEIAIQTPSLMSRYWNMKEESNRVFRDGWFYTGDSGSLDEEGFLHFLGRRKEMLKVNGMSVFPSEIEVLMSKIPGIEGCGVVGQEDLDKGQIPIAFVQLVPGYKGKLNEKQIQQWCKENMAVYKVPIVRIIDCLPLTDTGKVKKGKLEKDYLQKSY